MKQYNKYVYVDVSGGEPTLWPQFQEFVDTITDDRVFVEFSTNASRTLRYWEQFKTQRTFVILSWHYEEIDDDHFFKVAEIMQNKASVSIPLMIVPDNFERAKVLFERLKSLNVEITPKFTRKNIHMSEYFEYTDEQRVWITSNYFNKMTPFQVSWKIPQNLHFNGEKIKFMKVVDQGLDNFNGFSCTAGIRRIYVQPDGTIKRCSKGVGGILGNIYTEYTIPDTPVVCTLTSCPCKLDAIVEKWSPDMKK
jgi:MoaA/NifB/PqqE/SkfB family radical SAM enzyme